MNKNKNAAGKHSLTKIPISNPQPLQESKLQETIEFFCWQRINTFSYFFTFFTQLCPDKDSFNLTPNFEPNTKH